LTVIAAANPFDSITFPAAALHKEVRAKFRPGFNRSFHQHLIELATSRSISPRHVSHPNVSSNQRKISEVGEMRGKWRAVCSNDSLQQTPIGEPLWAMTVDEVPPVHIAGKDASFKKQHPMALAGQQHCRHSTCAPGANHNRVVHITLR
jgi:hypothetical protein